MIEFPKYESTVLAHAVEIWVWRARMNYAQAAAYLSVTRKTLWNMRMGTSRWAHTREAIFHHIAWWHLKTGVAITPRPLALPFPADPHGDHPECDDCA
jgi:hypothetical protein